MFTFKKMWFLVNIIGLYLNNVNMYFHLKWQVLKEIVVVFLKVNLFANLTIFILFPLLIACVAVLK